MQLELLTKKHKQNKTRNLFLLRTSYQQTFHAVMNYEKYPNPRKQNLKTKLSVENYF